MSVVFFLALAGSVMRRGEEGRRATVQNDFFPEFASLPFRFRHLKPRRPLHCSAPNTSFSPAKVAATIFLFLLSVPFGVFSFSYYVIRVVASITVAGCQKARALPGSASGCAAAVLTYRVVTCRGQNPRLKHSQSVG